MLATWDIMLSEMSQTLTDNTVCFHLHRVPRVVKFTDTKSRRRLRGPRGNWGVTV